MWLYLLAKISPMKVVVHCFLQVSISLRSYCTSNCFSQVNLYSDFSLHPGSPSFLGLIPVPGKSSCSHLAGRAARRANETCPSWLLQNDLSLQHGCARRLIGWHTAALNVPCSKWVLNPSSSLMLPACWVRAGDPESFLKHAFSTD